MESLDYRYHRICLNKHSQLAADGSLRMVLSHRDPGLANWLKPPAIPTARVLALGRRHTTGSPDHPRQTQ
jgi:hypothetical protein